MRMANAELMRWQPIIVIAVHWLTILEQDIVGNVHDIVDWPNARIPQANLQPHWTLAQLNVLDDPGFVGWCNLWIRDRNLQHVSSFLRTVFLNVM